MKNKKVISEINRTREIMGLELLNEQLQPTFHLWSWCHSPGPAVYYVGPYGLQGAQLAQASASFYALMQSPSPGEIIHITFDPTLPQRRMCYEYLGTSTTAVGGDTGGWGTGQYMNGGPIRDPGSYPTCQDCQVGAMDWECVSPGAACQQTPNGTHSTQGACQAACPVQLQEYDCVNGTCVATPSGGQYTGQNAQSDCQAACSCAQYGIDYDPVTGDNSQGGWFTQGYTAMVGPNQNCNSTINKIAQGCPSNWSAAKCQCRMDYLNFLLTLCQGSSGTATVSNAFINTMTTMYNGTGGPSGCWGLSGNNTNSVCGKKAYFCGLGTSGTPMQQAKCTWLTTFTANNNCNC